MQVTYWGTNTLVIKKSGSTLLVDPHFSRPGIHQLLTRLQPNQHKVAQGLNHAGIQRMEGVLLTHTHYDHALDAPEVICQVGGVLYGSESAVNLAEGSGLSPGQYQEVRAGETFRIGIFEVKFHPSRHLPFPVFLRWLLLEDGRIKRPLVPPTWFWNYAGGKVYAIQVDHLLIFGSAGFMGGVYAGLDVNAVVLGVGGLDTRSCAYLKEFYSETVLASGAEHVYISHWDNFFQPTSRPLKPLGMVSRSISQIEVLAKQNGQTTRILAYGEPCEV